VNNRFEKKRMRGKHSSQLFPIVTCVGCFEDPMVKLCLIELQFLLEISHSHFFNLDDGIVCWRSVEASGFL